MLEREEITLPSVEDIQDQLNLYFHNPDLLLQALTHRSFVNERNPNRDDLGHNERLEFLGDAILDFIAGDWLYEQFPDMREGQLTRLRAALVCTEMLADFALDIGLDQLIRMGHGEEENGGRSRKNTLCGTFEALVGALYLDQGMRATREFIIEPRFEPALDEILQKVSTKDAKSRLQEWSQAQQKRITPEYITLSSIGPDHARQFTVEVRLKNVPLGWGNGRSKREAQQNAAQMALEVIKSQPAEPPRKEKRKRIRKRKKR